IVNAVLQQTFSARPRLDDPANLDFAQYLALIVVAGGVGVYHWIVLRGDAAARPPKPAPAPAATRVAVIAAPAATEPAHAPEALEPHGGRDTLIVKDATEDDVQSVLASFSHQSGFKLLPTD